MKIRLITTLGLLVTACLPGIAKQPDDRRPLEIAGADTSILQAHVIGPQYSAPEVFQGGEDFYNPRIERLRQQYDFLAVIRGEENDFSKILKLRHWVHSQWPIDDEQSFSGDAFAILQHARSSGEGFHCAHAMTVQYAVLTASGYVVRNLGIDRSHTKFGRNDTWYRGAGDSLAEHWAYAAGAFIPIAQRQRIEWTPGVVSLARTSQVESGRLRVEPRSSTPNFDQYRYRIGDAPWQPLEGGQSIDWPLVPGVNTLQVRTRNLFGVEGPTTTAEVINQ